MIISVSGPMAPTIVADGYKVHRGLVGGTTNGLITRTLETIC